MIKIRVLNMNDEEIEYEYRDVKELEEIWKSDDIDMNVPENDAEVTYCEKDGKVIFEDIVDKTFKRNGTDTVWFEDLLTYFGIEIWY